MYLTPLNSECSSAEPHFLRTDVNHVTILSEHLGKGVIAAHLAYPGPLASHAVHNLLVKLGVGPCLEVLCLHVGLDPRKAVQLFENRTRFELGRVNLVEPR